MMKKALLVLCILSGAANASDAGMQSTISPQVTDDDCNIAYEASPASTSCRVTSLVSRGDTCMITADCRRKDGNWNRNVNQFNFKDMYRLHNCDGVLLPYNGC